MLKDVLKKMRVDYGFTQAFVAEYLNIHRPSYAHYESGQNKPDYEALCKLADLYNVSVDFILERNEKGFSLTEMRLLKAFNQANAYAKEVAFFALENSKGKAFNTTSDIPTFSIDEYRDYPASAGTGTYIDDAQKATLKLTKEPPSGACYVCRVSGDSMHGLYEDGDRVFVSVEPVSEGGVGIFIYNNEIYIKRAGKGCLLSENPDYPPIIIHDSDSLFCIGTVLGKVDEDDIITG